MQQGKVLEREGTITTYDGQTGKSAIYDQYRQGILAVIFITVFKEINCKNLRYTRPISRSEYNAAASISPSFRDNIKIIQR